jgi:hypothetical protein
MAEVYLAWDTRLERDVAVKMIHMERNLQEQQEYVRAF